MDGIGNLSPLGYPFLYLISGKLGLLSFGAVKPSTSLTEPLLAALSWIGQNNPKRRVVLFPTLCNLIFNII